MGATTTQGTGAGAADNIKATIKNGTINTANIVSNAVHVEKIDRAPVKVTSSTLTVTESLHANKVVNLSRAAGIAVTLPKAHGLGDKYTFMLDTTITSNTTTIKVEGGSGDLMAGRSIASSDNGTTTNNVWLTQSNTNTITLNGGTTSGYVGDTIEITDLAEGLWVVNCFLKETGTEATPFSHS